MTKDPTFKFHMVYAFVWLIGGSVAIFFLFTASDCNLEANPLCPEQLMDLQIKGVIMWCVISGIMIGLRIISHKYRMEAEI